MKLFNALRMGLVGLFVFTWAGTAVAQLDAASEGRVVYGLEAGARHEEKNN